MFPGDVGGHAERFDMGGRGTSTAAKDDRTAAAAAEETAADRGMRLTIARRVPWTARHASASVESVDPSFAPASRARSDGAVVVDTNVVAVKSFPRDMPGTAAEELVQQWADGMSMAPKCIRAWTRQRIQRRGGEQLQASAGDDGDRRRDPASMAPDAAEPLHGDRSAAGATEIAFAGIVFVEYADAEEANAALAEWRQRLRSVSVGGRHVYAEFRRERHDRPNASAMAADVGRTLGRRRRRSAWPSAEADTAFISDNSTAGDRSDAPPPPPPAQARISRAEWMSTAPAADAETEHHTLVMKNLPRGMPVSEARALIESVRSESLPQPVRVSPLLRQKRDGKWEKVSVRHEAVSTKDETATATAASMPVPSSAGTAAGAGVEPDRDGIFQGLMFIQYATVDEARTALRIFREAMRDVQIGQRPVLWQYCRPTKRTAKDGILPANVAAIASSEGRDVDLSGIAWRRPRNAPSAAPVHRPDPTDAAALPLYVPPRQPQGPPPGEAHERRSGFEARASRRERRRLEAAAAHAPEFTPAAPARSGE